MLALTNYVLRAALLSTTVTFLVLGTSEKIELIYHQSECSWNTAENVCKENGGHLVKINNDGIRSVIRFFSENDWDKVHDLLENHYWIGLYNTDMNLGKFAWVDCSTLGDFDNWDRREPNNYDSDRCIIAHEEDQEWHTQPCQREYQFLCQKAVGPCTYTTRDGRKFGHSEQYNSTLLSKIYSTIENCQSECTVGVNPDNSCWAVTYMYKLFTQPNCVLHTGSNPAALMSTDNTEPDNGAISSVRICYEARHDKRSIPTSLDYRNVLPQNCTEPPPNTPNTDIGLSTTTISSNDPAKKTSSDSSEDQPIETVSTSPDVLAPRLDITTAVGPLETTLELSSSSPEDQPFETISVSSYVGTVRPDATTTNGPPTSFTVSSAGPVGSHDKITTTGYEVQPSGIQGAKSGSTVADAQSDITVATPTAQQNTSVGTTTTPICVDPACALSGTTDLTKPTVCYCPCASSMTEEESKVVISNIMEDLVIEKKNVSAYKRKYTSAPDDRPSARGIGYTGAVLLGIVFGGLVLLDLPKLCADIVALYNFMKSCCSASL